LMSVLMGLSGFNVSVIELRSSSCRNWQNVKDQDILSYLEKRKVTRTSLSLFKSKRKATISAKLHIPANECSLIENEIFWPKFMKCKLWKPNSIVSV
jgi:hypothetical protein